MTTKIASDDSKFRMILLVARRARQIQAGAKPLIHTTARKSTRVAQEELKAGVLPFEILPTPKPEETPKQPAPKSKS